ncbi:MAG: ComEC family competence protein, partial [Clostridia bacterium]|nr:ComEC family competence protein [Clostridia bacterium]
MINRIKTHILNRPLAGIIAFYIVGNFIASVYDISKVFIAASVLGLYSVFLVIKGLRKKSYNFIVSIFCVFAFLSGSFYVNYYDNTNQIALKNSIGESGWVYGTVISSPKISNNGNHYSVIVKADKIELENEAQLLDGNIRLFVSIRDNTAPVMNERVMFYTELLKPDFKEGTFDYDLYLKGENIYATGFADVIYPDHSNTAPNGVLSKFTASCRKLSENISNQLEKVFCYDSDACAVIKGILLGDKTDFSKNLTEDFSTSGISHIAAVSGLHLSILFSVLCGLLGFLKIRKKFVSIVILPTILIFSAVTGFSPSVCRAAIMLAMYLFALITKRQYDSITALFMSAFIILTVNPYAIFDISFILSTVSTLSIILFYPILQEKFSPFCKENKVLLFILSSLALSVSVLHGTAPFTSYYFGELSLFSIIANLWIIPLCAPIFVLGYSVCLLSIFLPEIICSFILYPLATLIEIVILTTKLSSSLDFFTLSFPDFSPYWIILYYMPLIIFLLKRKS